jgi:hypothetical protein
LSRDDRQQLMWIDVWATAKILISSFRELAPSSSELARSFIFKNLFFVVVADIQLLFDASCHAPSVSSRS